MKHTRLLSVLCCAYLCVYLNEPLCAKRPGLGIQIDDNNAAPSPSAAEAQPRFAIDPTLVPLTADEREIRVITAGDCVEKLSQYKFVRELGRGKFGEAFETVDTLTAARLTHKKIRQYIQELPGRGSSALPVNEYPEYLNNEVQLQIIASTLDYPVPISPRVVDYWVCDEDDSPYGTIVMEYIDGVSLLAYMRNKLGLPVEPKLRGSEAGQRLLQEPSAQADVYSEFEQIATDPYMQQARESIARLHTVLASGMRIDHGDLHAENIMIGRLYPHNDHKQTIPPDSDHVFIIDYGLARLTKGEPIEYRDDDFVSTPKDMTETLANNGKLLRRLIRDLLDLGPLASSKEKGDRK